MTSVTAGHIILTPTQPVGSGRPQRDSNPGPHDQESCALPTELQRPPPPPPPPCMRAKSNETRMFVSLNGDVTEAVPNTNLFRAKIAFSEKLLLHGIF